MSLLEKIVSGGQTGADRVGLDAAMKSTLCRLSDRMHIFLPDERIFICGLDERDDYDCRQITHLVTVSNPGVNSIRPSWFAGEHLELWFGDVASEADAASYNTTPPGINDIERALSFFRAAWAGGDAKILVSCDYGASRSPALAYIFIADCLGPGREADAFNVMLDIRPDAVPNGLVVRLGDIFLERKGALLAPLTALYRKIDEELFSG